MSMLNWLISSFRELLSHPAKRTSISFYFSALFHLFLVSIFLLPLIPQGVIFCGMEEEEKVSSELSLQFEFSSEDGSSGEMSEALSKSKIQSKTKSSDEKGESDIASMSNPNLSKLKNGEWKDLLDRLESTKDMRKNFLESYDKVIDNGLVSREYIKRYRHFEDMVVKDVFPTINSIENDFKDDIQKSEEVLENHNTRNQIIEDFRNSWEEEDVITLEKSSDPAKNKKTKNPPLSMGKKERDEYFDSILKNAKEDQLQEFINTYSKYDPNTGDLPLVFRDLYYKNLQRLAYTFSQDPTYFTSDYFEENLNKEDYLRNSMALISKWEKTKTSTEILFSILDIYEIQERAIYQYFQNLEFQKTLTSQDKKQIRNEMIRQVIEKYGKIFKDKNITSYEEIVDMYYKKKVSIGDYLLATSPDNYRVKDILFERGRIYWEQGIKKNKDQYIEKGINEWKKIPTEKNTGDFLNAETYELLKPYISNSRDNKDTITSILSGRMTKHLESKREREERLLYPR